MYRNLLLTASFLFYATCAFADVYVWTNNAANCTINDQDNTIQINVAGTYGFRAWNGDAGNPALENIQNITIASSVSGDVTVRIAYDSAGGNGAADVEKGNLTRAGRTIDLAALNIAGNLATTGNFVCNTVTGTVNVAGTLGDGPESTVYTLQANSITGTLNVGTLIGNISTGTLHDVNLTGTSYHLGSITTTADYDYTITIGQDTDPPTLAAIATNISIPNFTVEPRTRAGDSFCTATCTARSTWQPTGAARCISTARCATTSRSATI
jgi:hypothetical protein